MHESELVHRCRAGEREAQRELYALNADRIYRLLLRMTGNADDALELAQDVFVRALDRLDRFDGRSRIGTWIYQIAVNEGRQFLRRRKHQQILMAEIEAPDDADARTAADNRLDVAAALDQMPEEERTLLVLRHFEELSYEEIAATVQKPAGTIASGLNRARRMLRELLSPENLPRT